MTTLREAAQQALEALELGYDSAKAEADQYHAAMAGYRPQRHAQMDDEVQQIASAITALRAALEERDNYAESASILAQAVVLAEREKCAQLVETYEKAGNTMNAPEYVMVFKDCAAAIRARGRQ